MNCPICKSERTSFVTNKLRFENTADVHACGNCGLEFLDQNSFTLPKDFYEKEYHQTYVTHVEPDALDPKKYFEKMSKVIGPWVDRLRPLLSSDDIVLDVGCSTGHLMSAIKDDVSAVHGHELSEDEVKFCQKELGLDVDSKSLKDRFKPQTFDKIVLFFVLEHIGNPKEFIEELKTVLKDDGKLIILIPSISDPH